MSAKTTAAGKPTSGDTDCVSLLADLDAGKPCMAEAAETIRLLIVERDAARGPAAPQAAERRECDECGFKGSSEDRNKEQDYCTACGGNSPAGGPDECAHCGAKNHMVMACPKCGGRFSLDEDAREEAPADPCASHKAEGLALDPCCPTCEAPAEAGEDDRLSPEQAWAELLEKADRNSPEDRPEMLLITWEEMADYMARARSSAPEAREDRRHPLPASLLDESNTEAMAWITTNAMAIRRENGDMDYSLGAMIAAYKAGKGDAKTPHDILTRIAKAASEGVAKNAGIAPQLAFAPILWALEDGFSGSKLKPATMKDVLLAAAQSRDLHMSDRLALEWCAEQPEALAALKAAADGSSVIGDGGAADKIIDGQVTTAMLRRMAEAHDAEEAAQKGEPSPWREDLDPDGDPSWVKERISAMRCAVEAVQHGGEPAPGAWMFRIDGKWELSIIDPREHLHLAPEDVISVPISAQPTADFVAKAKHLLSLAEEAEDKTLVGDEGCVWPVEALRAAYAALPFVMTITLGGDND